MSKSLSPSLQKQRRSIRLVFYPVYSFRRISISYQAGRSSDPVYHILYWLPSQITLEGMTNGCRSYRWSDVKGHTLRVASFSHIYIHFRPCSSLIRYSISGPMDTVAVITGIPHRYRDPSLYKTGANAPLVSNGNDPVRTGLAGDFVNAGGVVAIPDICAEFLFHYLQRPRLRQRNNTACR